MLNLERIQWQGGEALSPGKHTVEFDFRYGGLGAGTLAYGSTSGMGQGGTGTLKVNGDVVATRKMKHAIPVILQWDEPSCMDGRVRMPELARNAQSPCERQPARERRRLLDFVQSNGTWEQGEVVATFRQPLDLLAETSAAADRAVAGQRAGAAKTGIWLGNLDSNQD